MKVDIVYIIGDCVYDGFNSNDEKKHEGNTEYQDPKNQDDTIVLNIDRLENKKDINILFDFGYGTNRRNTEYSEGYLLEEKNKCKLDFVAMNNEKNVKT